MNTFHYYRQLILSLSFSVLFLIPDLSCTLGFAQTAEEVPLSLKVLVEEAIKRNPQIQVAKERWEASKAVIPQVKTLPDPELKFGYQQIPAVSPIQGAIYGLGQQVPFPGKLKLRGEVASRQADRIEQEFNATRLHIVARLKEAYYDLHFVHEAIEIVERNRLLLIQFEKTAKARYAVARAAQQDIFRAQVEISRVIDRLAVLEQQKESLHAAINRILNRPPADPLGTPPEFPLTPLTLSLPELNQRASQFSPILLASAKGIERENQSVALARREYYPDFDLNALGLRNDRINTNGYQITLGIRIPLYYTTKQRQGVNEALATLSRAKEDLLASRQEVLFQVKDAFVRAKRAERLIKVVGNAIIPQATLALQSAQAGYAVGKVDFLTLLNNLLTLQENELELHDERVSYEKAIARLEEMTGGRL